MSLTIISVIIFLFIFTATAIITLLSLIGRVKMQQQYQKQLFRLVILEVAAVVIGFVANTLKPMTTSYLTEKALVADHGWDSSYPERNWRTRAFFERKDGGIVFRATTYLVRADSAEVPLIRWRSIKPFKLAELSNEVFFPASLEWTAEAARVYPYLRNEAGKLKTGRLKLGTDTGMRGSWIADNTTETWGLMFNKTWH